MNYSYLDSERFTESAAAGCTAEMAHDERTQPENSFINSCLILDQATSTQLLDRAAGPRRQKEQRRPPISAADLGERDRLTLLLATLWILTAASFPHSHTLLSLIWAGLLAQTTDNATAISHTHADTERVKSKISWPQAPQR